MINKVRRDAFNIQKEGFIEDCYDKNLKESTISTYNTHIKLLENYLIIRREEVFLNEIEVTELKDFFRYLKNVRKNKQVTINSTITSIKRFYNYLEERNIIIDNPMKVISKGRVTKKPIIPFSSEEFKRLIKQPDRFTYVGNRDYILMLLLVSTGIRVTEALKLEIEDFDFVNNKLVVKDTKNRIPRVIGLDDKFSKEVKQFIKIFNLDKGLLLRNIYNGKLSLRTVQINFKEYGSKCKVDSRPKLFRKYFAINYLKNGGSTASLRAVLGHQTIETVEKYLYWSNDDILKECEKYSPKIY